jgi:hypothetical protein
MVHITKLVSVQLASQILSLYLDIPQNNSELKIDLHWFD